GSPSRSLKRYKSMVPDATTITSCASGSDASPLCCPTHHVALTNHGEYLECPNCGVVGRWKNKVALFLRESDPFYEGKYDNRTKYVPRDDSFLATLPLRVVLQGYPTAVARVLRAGSTVVEVGCAGGIDWFGRRYRLIGLDLSESSLRVAA